MALPHMHAPEYEIEPYPPTNPRTKLEISEGFSWGDVAATYSCSARDIFYFNFKTFTPEEINWYMWNYLGRTKLASDGKNLTFGVDPGNPSAKTAPPSKFKPGDHPWVYIPPTGWPTPSQNDEDLRSAVLSTLAQAEVAGLALHVGDLTLHPGELKTVRTNIKRRKVEVRHNSAISTTGQYRHRNWQVPRNTLEFRILKPTGTFGHSNIVHEAVHVALDTRGKHVKVAKSEALAYLAQALYLVRKGVPPHTTLDPFARPMLAAAEVIAYMMESGATVDSAQIIPLFGAIAAAYPAGSYDYDGLL